MTMNDRTLDQDRLSLALRGIEVFFALCLLLLFGFFIYHQTQPTGFFTEKFGTLEMFWLYAPLLFGLSAPLIRAWTGHRNPARPFEAATSLFLAVAALWLLSVFPFNFAHLADALPEGLRFLLAWITDGVGQFFLLLQIIIGVPTALVAIWRYFSFRGHTVTRRAV
ncbi:MAG: hypothetical protein JNM70_11855 [Anaerolineae bacterium]|nr:hypothetical protein [Anaerolineae bacterium]